MYLYSFMFHKVRATKKNSLPVDHHKTKVALTSGKEATHLTILFQLDDFKSLHEK